MKNKNKINELLDVNLKETDARTFLLFIQTADAILKYSDAILNKAGLSLVKLMVLQVLYYQGGTMRPSEIARLTMREKHNITTLIRRLQREQLVKVKRSGKDRRSINITITEKGKQAIIDVNPTAKNIIEQVMSSISDSSAVILEESLRTLRRNAYNGLQQIKTTSK